MKYYQIKFTFMEFVLNAKKIRTTFCSSFFVLLFYLLSYTFLGGRFMKVFIINRKFIFISFFIILFSFLIVLFIYRNYPNSTITTFNPIDSSKEYLLDLNGDGIKDSLKIVKLPQKIKVISLVNAQIIILNQPLPFHLKFMFLLQFEIILP